MNVEYFDGFYVGWKGQTKKEYKILTLERLVGDKLNDGGGDWWTDIEENQHYS
jgi:hypothetical protein